MRLSRLCCLVAPLLIAGCASQQPVAKVPDLSARPFTFIEDAPVRGDLSKKQIALIFTGGEFGEGAAHILDVLAERHIRGSFFVTGDFIRQKELYPQLKRIVADGHYLGPHSDAHSLYCPWEDRSRSLVDETFFRKDLQQNINDLRKLGALRDKLEPVYFIPPFEWYNSDQTQWARKMGVQLFNFSPGSGSNRDYAPEGHKSFMPSTRLMSDIVAYEQKDPHGLNGFLLLLHLGSERQDKVPPHLGDLLDELTRRGYTFVRIDQILQ